MTEPAPAPEAQPEAPAVEDTQNEELSPEALKAALAKARKDAANYRTKVRELEPLASKAKELEDAGRSDVERATARAEAAEKAAADAQREVIRYRVLSEVALPAELHEFVTGDTEDDVRAKAEKLLAQLPKPDGRPKGDAGLGPRPTPPPVTDGSPRSLIAAGLATSDAAKK